MERARIIPAKYEFYFLVKSMPEPVPVPMYFGSYFGAFWERPRGDTLAPPVGQTRRLYRSNADPLIVGYIFLFWGQQPVSGAQSISTIATHTKKSASSSRILKIVVSEAQHE